MMALKDCKLTAARRDVAADTQDLYRRLLGSHISRRTLLAASLGTVGLSPFMASLARAASGFRVVRRKSYVAIEVGDQQVFRVSPEMFDGNAHVACEHTADSLRICVVGGRLPGTSVPADLHLSVLRDGADWNGAFSLPALGFQSEFGFEQWLLGQPVARGQLTTRALITNTTEYSLQHGTDVPAVFYPAWTFELRPRAPLLLTTSVGNVQASGAQLELVAADAPTLGLAVNRAPRTRLWLNGVISATRRLPVERGAAAFHAGAMDAVVELQRDASGAPTAGLAMERRGTDVVGEVTPGSQSSGSSTGFPARDLRITALCGQWKRAAANLNRSSIWTPFKGASVELVARNQTFSSACTSGSGDICVARIVVPIAGLDQAVFIRRGAVLKDGASMDVTKVRASGEVDGLGWLDDRRRRPGLPLREFDLHLSRGADALRITMRFKGVVLRLDGAKSRLLPTPDNNPLLEYAFAPQHVYEEALYVTELPGRPPRPSKRYLTDEDICKELKLGEGAACRDALCCARVSGNYNQLYQEALKRIEARDPGPQPAKPFELAASRFAAESWFTFEWRGDDLRRKHLRLDLEHLFAWARKPSDDGPQLCEKRSKFAWRAQASTADHLAAQVPNAHANGRPASLAEPTPQNAEAVSAIQAPYRLALTRIDDAPWRVRGYVSGAPRNELWSVRAERLQMRAVWSPDFEPDNFWANNKPHERIPFLGSLDGRDRHEIVALSARYGERALLGSPNVMAHPSIHDQEQGIYIPQPLQVRIALLSSHGATLRLRGTWSPPAAPAGRNGALTVELWDQNSQLARDNKVVVEYKGFLFPLGHPATLVKETERRLVLHDQKGVVARLVQRFFIRVPGLTRSGALHQQPFQGRGWPFGDITMRATVTADLDDPKNGELPELGLGQQAFWPHVAPLGDEAAPLVDFEFEDTTTGVKASAPLIFIDNSIAHTPALLLQVVHHYRNQLEQARRGPVHWSDTGRYRSKLLDAAERPAKFVARVGSGKVRFAPEDRPGNTSFRVLRLLLDVDIPHPPGSGHVEPLCAGSCAGALKLPNADAPDFALEESAANAGNTDLQAALVMRVPLESRNQPPFYPHLRQALVEAGTLSRLANIGRQLALVEIDGHFLRHGFDAANSGEIYLRYVDDGAALEFAHDTTSSGGFADTSTRMSAVSRKQGPIGGASDPRPQAPGYRYGAQPNPAAPRAFLTIAPGQEEDPVRMARQGAADPREFFGRSLGNAKLCGVVSFADIVDVVMKASGARAPQIVEQLESAVPMETIRAVAQSAAKTLREVIETDDASSGTPVIPARIRAAIIDVINLLERAQAASSAAALLPLAGSLLKAFERLRDEVRTALENPIALLPPQAAGWMAQLQALHKAIDRGAIQAVAEQYLLDFAAILRVEALARIETELLSDSRYRQLCERVADVRRSIGAIEAAAKGDPLQFLRVLSTEMLSLTDGAVDLSAWSIWLDHNQEVLAGQLDEYWKLIIAWLAGQQGRIEDAAKALEQKLLEALNEIDAKLATEAQSLGQTAQARLSRAFLEISELNQSAAAHASGLKAAATELKEFKPREQGSLEALQRAATTLRGALDAAAKARRFTVLIQELAADPAQLFTHDQLKKWVEAYRPWVELVAEEFLTTVLGRIHKEASKATTPALDRATRSALEWLIASIFDAQGVAARLGLGAQLDAQGRLIITAPAEDLRTLYAVVGFLEGAPDPKRMAQQALQAAQLAGHERLIAKLRDCWVRIAGLLDPVAQNVDAALGAVTADPKLQKWIAPSMVTRLGALRTSLSDAAADPPAENVITLQRIRDYFKVKLPAPAGELKALFEEVADVLSNGDVSALVNVREAVDSALQELGVPTKATITYDWKTQVHAYPSGAGPVFEPLAGTGNLTIASRTAIDLVGGRKPEMSLSAHLDAFKINLFGKTPFLTIIFHPLEFTAATGRAAKLTADVDRVEFGGQLAFIKKLQEWLKEKFGITVAPWSEGPGVVVGYEFFEELITATAFSLQNVGFAIACVLPFNSQPARFRFSLSQPEKPFLLSVGIYGGGGYVGIQSRADTIEYIEASFEYGLVTSFKFGVASGTGRITAGIYIRVSKRSALLSGFFNASGNCDVAGLITVCANFRVQIWYDTRSGKAAGAATFRISFSIGLADFSYSVGVAYARKGDGGGGSESQSPPRSEQMLMAASIQPLDEEALAERKAEIAKAIETDEKTGDLSKELLHQKTWDRYWAAFEETFDECA